MESLEPRTLLAGNPIVGPGVQVGTITQLVEISGVAASRSLPGNLWVHQDSGDSARFYGLNPSGTINSIVTLSGAPAVDWEDMAIGPKPSGGNYLYFGDIGDNSANRLAGVDIIRVTEPTATGNVTLTSADYLVKRVLYPGILVSFPKNAESLFVDPLTSDIYIVTKQNPGGLYRLPANQFEAAGSSTLESLGNINAPLNNPTSADITPDGRFIVVRNSSAGGTTAYLFERGPGQTVAQAMQNAPTTHTLQAEAQGEAVGWSPDGSGFYSVSEGTGVPIRFYTLDTMPMNVSAGGPYAVNEGAGVSLAGSAVAPGTLTYTWDINDDGNFGDAAGQNPTLSWPQLQALGVGDGPAGFNVRVRVDNGAHPPVDSSATSLSVNNAPPTASAGGPYAMQVGDTLHLAASGSDPAGAADPLTFSWDVNGDGVFGDTAGDSPSLTWTQLNALGIAGPLTIGNLRVRVDDGDGGIATSAAATLSVLSGGAQTRISVVSLDGRAVHNFDTAGNGSPFADAADGLAAPIGGAYDSAGNLYVADVLAGFGGSGSVLKVDGAGAGGTFADLLDGVVAPTGVAVDVAGNLYVAAYLTHQVLKITPAGAASVFADAADGVNRPFDVAIDPTTGNVFVANLDSRQVLKITPAGAASVFADAADGLFTPIGLAVDNAGQVYVSDVLLGRVMKFDPAGVGAVFADFSDGLTSPTGLALDAVGNLYVANYLSSTVTRLTPAGAGALFADAADGIQSPFDVAIGSVPISPPPPAADAVLASALLDGTGPAAPEPATAAAASAAAVDAALADEAFHWLAYRLWQEQAE